MQVVTTSPRIDYKMKNEEQYPIYGKDVISHQLGNLYKLYQHQLKAFLSARTISDKNKMEGMP